MDTISQIHNI